jgi:hypothetical protein
MASVAAVTGSTPGVCANHRRQVHERGGPARAAASAIPEAPSPSTPAPFHVALKEWGGVVGALAAGQQTVIFRKGGLKAGAYTRSLQTST